VRRDLSQLANTRFDLLVVGGGIQGACIAWDAALRGLSVALVDQGDFGAATSANSLRIVHGGLRYLARGDFPRMLESIRERSALLRIAPGWVEPLAMLVPTYRSPLKSPAAYGLALATNDLVSWRRNRGLAPDRLIPRGRLVSRELCLQHFPWFSTPGLTGGALWYDARLRHPERLTLSFLYSAAERGAVPANYMRVERLLLANGAVHGALVTDCIGGAELEVRADRVVVAAGPWTSELIARTIQKTGRPTRRAFALNVTLGRRLADVAVGVQSRSGADEDPICGGHRFLFAVPQGEGTVLGTWYAAEAADVRATIERGVSSLVRELEQACPGLSLSAADVTRCQWGWLPLKDGLEPGRADALAERPRIQHHGRQDGVRHLLSVEGVKYTTARAVAERVVDQVFADLGRPAPACRTGEERLVEMVDEMALEPDGTVGKAGVMRAVRDQMAVKLSDIVLRRSSLGMVASPSRTSIEHLARIAGAELGWDPSRQEAEVEDVMEAVG
jgi:glycerol-3-phosphate dehydrogenase